MTTDHPEAGRRKGLARSYDHVIVGAGSAGCVVARRLVDGTDATVLLLEATDLDVVLRTGRRRRQPLEPAAVAGEHGLAIRLGLPIRAEPARR